MVILTLMLQIHHQVGAACVYQKYFNKKLDDNHSTAYAHLSVRGALDCDKICLDHGPSCVGANVVASGKYYNCSLFSRMPNTVTKDMLLGNKNGKFLVKIRDESLIYQCQKAF